MEYVPVGRRDGCSGKTFATNDFAYGEVCVVSLLGISCVLAFFVVTFFNDTFGTDSTLNLLLFHRFRY